MHQDALPGLQLCVVVQSLPCGESANRHSGGLGMSETFRFMREVLRGGKAKFGGRAIFEPVIHSEDFVVYGKSFDAVAESSDHAGELVSRDSMTACAPVFVVG